MEVFRRSFLAALEDTDRMNEQAEQKEKNDIEVLRQTQETNILRGRQFRANILTIKESMQGLQGEIFAFEERNEGRGVSSQRVFFLWMQILLILSLLTLELVFLAWCFLKTNDQSETLKKSSSSGFSAKQQPGGGDNLP